MRTTLPDGTFFENTYDALGQVLSRRDTAGNVTAFTYDAEGNLLTVTLPGGAVTRYEYDGNGNMISSTDALGHKTLYEYDKMNRLLKKTFPDTSMEVMAYNAGGFVTSKTDRNGKITTYEYDNRNRVTKISYADGKTVTYTYTQTGKRDTVTDSRGVTDFDYDALDRVSRVRYPDGTPISYGYDLAGNRTSITTPDGTTVYTYDAGNQLTKVTDPRGLITSYDYDSRGNVVGINHPNGLTTARTYDEKDQLMSVKTTKAGGGVVFEETYVRDANGRRTKVTQLDGSSIEYAYDALSRLQSETYKDAGGVSSRQLTYTYDAVGNRLTLNDNGVTITYTYNASDQLTSDGVSTYTYDANGNTLTRSAGGSSVRYTYDSRDKLTQVTQPDDSTLNYVYDADGNRIRSVGPGGTTNYLVDPTIKAAQVVVETDGSGHVVASYTYGLGLISQRRNGADSFYLADALGSTRMLTNNQGVVTDTYSYDAFGELLSTTGTTVNSFLYTGEQKDEAAGLYYLRARYYNPANGRFLTADRYQGSVESPQTQNKYAYVENNPVNLTDPLGLYSRGQGSAIDNEIGKFYIMRHGDYFVDRLRRRPNKGFPRVPRPWGGWGAFDRGIRTGIRGVTLRVDLRHYAAGDVYEVKPLSVYGLTTAVGEAWAYKEALNFFEPEVDWDLGYRTFPAVIVLPYAASSTRTLQVFAAPLMPSGAVIYTENLLRDLSDPRVVRAARKFGYLLVKRLQMLAPRLIQASSRAGFANMQNRIALSAATRGL